MENIGITNQHEAINLLKDVEEFFREGRGFESGDFNSGSITSAELPASTIDGKHFFIH